MRLLEELGAVRQVLSHLPMIVTLRHSGGWSSTNTTVLAAHHVAYVQAIPGPF